MWESNRILVSLAFLVALMLCGPSPLSAGKFEIEVELAWGKGGKVDWAGGLNIIEGKILEVDPFLLNKRDELQVVSDTEIKWMSQTSGYADGIRVKLIANVDTKLEIVTQQGSYVVAVSDLLKAPVEWRSDKKRLVAKVSLRNSIWLEAKRTNYIFSPNEEWLAEWYLNLFGFGASGKINYSAEIFEDETGDSVASWSGSMKSLPGGLVASGVESIIIPEKEGVYSFVLQPEIVGRVIEPLRVQFIVLDERADENMPLTESTGRVVQKISGGGLTERATFRHDGTASLLESGGVQYVITGKEGKRTSKVGDNSRTMNWFGYRFEIDNPGVPHVLKVSYPLHLPSRFVISLIDVTPGKTDRTRNNLDVGVAVTPKTGAMPGQSVKEIIFWPTTKQPTVAIINTLDGERAAISSLELIEYRNGLPGQANPYSINTSLLGPYFEEARILSTLGGGVSDDSSKSFYAAAKTDWGTFYRSINRLVEMLISRGENAVMMPVYTYGATLYPSKILPNNGRYDDGEFFLDGRDPVQKDVVRLMLKVFEQNNIKLIPIFAFYTELPELEKIRNTGIAGADGIDLINHKGERARDVLRFRDSHAQVGPRYNPLNPLVWNQVGSAIEEFIARYKDSPALGDIALQINTTGWLQYPGRTWGYDRITVQNFLDHEGLSGPEVHDGYYDAQSSYQYLSQPEIMPIWTSWRNQRIRDGFTHLGRIVSQHGNDRKIVLAYVNTFTSRYSEKFDPGSIDNVDDARELLRSKGIDPLEMSFAENVRIWRPIRTPWPYSEATQRRANIYNSKHADAIFEGAGADGVIEFNDYYESKLMSIENNWWTPLTYRMVAVIRDESASNYLACKKDLACFSGGWHFTQ